ncbi:MAG: hypothetical protein EOO75_11195, partial [Myxococcales bacterium]
MGLPYESDPAGAVVAPVAGPSPGPEGRRGAAWARYWPASTGARRPRRGPVRAIVLHTAEGTAASAVAWFRRPG